MAVFALEGFAVPREAKTIVNALNVLWNKRCLSLLVNISEAALPMHRVWEDLAVQLYSVKKVNLAYYNSLLSEARVSIRTAATNLSDLDASNPYAVQKRHSVAAFVVEEFDKALETVRSRDSKSHTLAKSAASTAGIQLGADNYARHHVCVL